MVGEQDREGFIPVNERVHHESRPHSVGAAICRHPGLLDGLGHGWQADLAFPGHPAALR